MTYFLSLLLAALGVALSAVDPSLLGVQSPGHRVWRLWAGSLQAYGVPVGLAVASRFVRPWGYLAQGLWFGWIFVSTILMAVFSREVISGGNFTLWNMGSLVLSLAGILACARKVLPKLGGQPSNSAP